ncbi:hypothetical protein H5410_034829 [Solanum commersonii]|uniref:Ubiquitin-like protease family profile domain-containing protein n=1 Tax=Solanum commersonii TaxID=4109 RepID=A0A9J5YRR3_SOLCO|nr:hypothetical protein H5410_034829 [Solanum commersonii]
MDAQSPSKRFTRGIPLHVENSVERPSFSLGLTQDFGEVSGSMSKSNTMQEIKSKLKNNPIRLEGMSAKSKQSNIKIVEGGKKDQSAAGSSKKRKEKTTNYTEENAKRKKVVVSGLLEHNEAVKFLGKREPTRIPHMQCYTNIEVMKVLATKLTISQYKEFCGTTCFAQLSSIRRCHVQAQLIRCMFLREIEGSSKDAILIHVNGTTLRFTIRDFAIITGLKCSDNEKDFVFNTEEPNRIILQYFGVEKAITKSQLVEKFDNKVWGDNDDDAVKFAILFYIHSFILSEEPTSIDRKDFDLVESGRYIDYPWGKKAFDLLILHLHTKIKHDGKYFRLYGFPLALQVWFYECCSNFDKEIAVKVSHHIPRILNWKTKKDFPRLSYFAKGMFRDDNNPNITPTPMELKILELPPEYVQSDSSPIWRNSFIDLRNFIENNFKVVLDSIKSKNAEDKGDGVEVTDKVPVGVVQSEEPSQHLPSELNCQSVFNDLNDQEGHNNSGVPINFTVQNTSNIFEVQNNSEQDLLNVVHDQTEKMEKEELSDTNKAGSSNVNKLVVEEVLMPPAPLQMVYDDQPNINPERSMVLHPLLAVDEHTPLPIHRKAPVPIQHIALCDIIRLVVRSSSRFHFSFDLKHPFVAMSDLERTTLYIHFWKWLNEGLLVRHNTKNGKEELIQKEQVLSYKCGFILELSPKTRTGSIGLHTKINCLMTRNINKESTEESIIEYINGYRMHVARPWHTVDNILIPVNIKEIFHWILIVVSINDRSIQIYDSLRGGALHDSSVENEIKKYAQLVPMYLSKSDFYGKKGIDISSHPNDCGLYVAAYADHISNGNVVPKSFDSEFTRIQYASLLWNYGVQKIQADATSDSEAPERPTRIHRDCDSSEKITIN